MANVERAALYVGAGFLIGLFIMTRFSALRPKSLSMSSMYSYPVPDPLAMTLWDAQVYPGYRETPPGFQASLQSDQTQQPRIMDWAARQAYFSSMYR